jgi:hypothetical protein
VFFLKGRKTRVELENYLSHISDITNPQGGSEEQKRKESRVSRIFPVLLAPWENDGPVMTQCTYGLTRDLSGHGVSVVIQRPFRKSEVVVGVWPTNEMLTAGSSQPGFILGEVRQEFEIGAAYYHLGILLKELVSAEHPSFDKLCTQAKCLLPPEQLRLLKNPAGHGSF